MGTDDIYSFFSSPLWIIQFGIIIKMVITPLLGIRTSRKFMAFRVEDEQVDELSFSISHQPFAWIKNIWHISGKSRLIPSKNVGVLISGFVLLLILVPLSPFSFQNLWPRPTVQGPFIYRNYTNSEALLALQSLESRSLTEVTGCSSSYAMDNKTLAFFLDRITHGLSIERNSIHTYAYALTWNVSLIQAEFPLLNCSTIDLSWLDPSDICFTWWENASYHHIYLEYADLNQTAFRAYTSPVKWIYYGWFKYSEAFGDVGGHYINGRQLAYLTENNTLLCIAYSEMHAVATSLDQ